MKVLMTEYLRIDLDAENWECRVCNHVIGSARGNYKEGLLVYNRDPADIHPHVIDPEKYRFTFCPDKDWVNILEFYCPGCGSQRAIHQLLHFNIIDAFRLNPLMVLSLPIIFYGLLLQIWNFIFETKYRVSLFYSKLFIYGYFGAVLLYWICKMYFLLFPG